MSWKTQEEFEKAREKMRKDMEAIAIENGDEIITKPIIRNKKRDAEITKFLKDLNEFEEESKKSKIMIG